MIGVRNVSTKQRSANRIKSGFTLNQTRKFGLTQHNSREVSDLQVELVLALGVWFGGLTPAAFDDTYFCVWFGFW